ncbi:N-acetylmuramoyl-L-alanine amidase [Ureibacillus chungkukjangi]|uniref:N-acetylmuramoyl-L-alanine amidase n=1 Tax=Ureibacillus chungkukjangi TaxID=1202712 RepID=UPI00384E9EEB
MKKMTLFVVITMITILGVYSPQVYATQQFVDVPSTHEASEEINYLVNNGVIKGYTENGKTYYKPSNSVTRGQAAKMVVIASGLSPLVVSKSSFSDIPAGTELSGYVERAVQKGFFDEINGTRFNASQVLTRGEMSKVLALSFNLDINKYASYSNPFSDISTSNKYYKYINAIYYSGLTQGDRGNYKPNNNLTRSQFALFVARGSSEKYRLDIPVQGVTVPNIADAKGQIVSTTNNLNVRSSASTSSTVVGQIHNGDKLYTYGLENGWYKVAFDNKYAYVSSSYAKMVVESGGSNDSNTGNNEVSSNLIGRATVDGLNVRASASSSSKSVGILNRGDEVAVLSISGFWAKINYKGQEAYAHKSYLKLINKTGSALKGRIIVLDPGHGGKDPGAVSGNYTEKAVVFKVANIVKQKLENAGATVKMTRTSDVFPSLEQRVSFAQANFAEVFVSIHVNSATNSSAKGTETYYSISANANEKEDYQLASNINSQIVNNASMTNRGVKREDWYVVRNSVFPSVLVELGFISNSEDRAKLVDDKYAEIFGDSIYKGILQYYSN